MLEAYFTADDIKNICIGFAAVITAVGTLAPLVWAYRRHPRSAESPPRLPPPD